MAIPASRQQFKDYILRRLGAPVIDINVDDEQVEDRIDDAIAKYRDYHYDGTEHVLYKHIVTSTDITNRYLTLPESIVGVTRIFDLGDSYSTSSMFNVRYQLHLNELFNITSVSVAPYVMAMRHIETLEEIFVGKKPIRFNRHTNTLHIDMAWATDVQLGYTIIVDGYASLDPNTYTDVWNDSWLKQYATALVKRQWGENLKLYEGMQLPGGITFNGQKIWEEANDMITTMETSLINDYSLPVTDMIG